MCSVGFAREISAEMDAHSAVVWLGLCDDLLDPNERELLFTFSPITQEVFDVFDEIARCKSKYVTTLGQVLDFVKFCAKDRSKYSYSVLAGDLSPEDLPKLNLADDLLVVIEFEDWGYGRRIKTFPY